MAELHVQKREQNVWPWIVAALVVLALLFWFLWGRDDGLDVGSADLTDSTLVGDATNASDPNGMRNMDGATEGAAVSQYLQFVDDRSSRASGVAHEYTADGLRRLAAALDERTTTASVGGVDVQPRIAEIRERADAIQQNPTSTEHALQVREAFAIVASLITQMNGAAANQGGDNMDGLQGAAMSIEPSQPLLNQADQIEQFFAQAGDAIRATR